MTRPGAVYEGASGRGAAGDPIQVLAHRGRLTLEGLIVAVVGAVEIDVGVERREQGLHVALGGAALGHQLEGLPGGCR